MQRHRLPVVLDPNLAQWAPLGTKLPFSPLAQEAGLNWKSGPWLALWPLSVGKQKLGIQGRKAEFDPIQTLGPPTIGIPSLFAGRCSFGAY
jgi:hypothetical protein